MSDCHEFSFFFPLHFSKICFLLSLVGTLSLGMNAIDFVTEVEIGIFNSRFQRFGRWILKMSLLKLGPSLLW